MFPVLIGAAVIGGIAYALSGDDKNNGQWYTEKRTIPVSELPPDILRRLKNSSRQSNEELLRAEGFKQIPASEVPAVREIPESRIPPDIRRKLKRQ